MATRRLDSAQKEVAEVRSRLYGQSWDSVPFDVRHRMRELNRLFNGQHEMLRHIVVASIATLQTFHRGTIVSIVESGEQYKQRAAEGITDKFSMKDALAWLAGKPASFGELVAHLSPCNSVTDMVSTLSTLLECDFKLALTDSIDPYDRRNNATDPRRPVEDVDKLFADLAEAFRLRHILAHEAASSLVITTESCEGMWAAVAGWIEGVEAVLWSTVYLEMPLTQAEMNRHAYAEVQKERIALARALRDARKWAERDDRRQWLRSNQRAWMRTAQDWTSGTYRRLDGTLWPSIAASELAAAFKARSKQLNAWIDCQYQEGYEERRRRREA